MAVGAFLVFVYGVIAFPVFRSLRYSLIMVGQRDSEGSCSGLGLSGFRSDFYSPCIRQWRVGVYVCELRFLLPGRVRWVVGSLDGRGWYFR